MSALRYRNIYFCFRIGSNKDITNHHKVDDVLILDYFCLLVNHRNALGESFHFHPMGKYDYEIFDFPNISLPFSMFVEGIFRHF
jgi:hypothetical protein